MKAPAFQFYPKDWDSDSNVIPMTYEEEGVYFALCRRYWLDGTLPSDLDRLRRLLKGKPSLSKMQRWWEAIAPCFQVDGNSLTHKRLDRERESQIAFREAKARAGAVGGRARSAQANAKQTEAVLDSASSKIEAKASSSSASSSAICDLQPAVEKAPANVTPIRRPRSMGAMGSSPVQHMGHSRCNDRGVCIPDSLYGELLGRLGNDVTRFNDFYANVLDTMPPDYVPTGTVFKWWHTMLDRVFPDVPVPKPSAREVAMKADW